jgi:hypothetical protein
MAHSPTAGRLPRSSWHVTGSWIAVALVPIVFPLWFVLGMMLVGDPNEPSAPQGWDGVWRVVVLWLAVAIVPVIGIVSGRRATRDGEPGARTPLIVNSLIFGALTLLTLVGGLSDVLS